MKIHIDDDFDLRKIADSGQCFRAVRVEGDKFRFIHGHRVLYIEDCGSGFFNLSCSEDEWSRVWRPYFDLDTDYSEIRSLASDPFMRQAAAAGTGIRILQQDPWETLISFIISQRKSIPAIRGCVEALASRFGRPILGEDGLFVFPTVDELALATEDDLNRCKLGYRTPYVLDAVHKVSGGEIDLSEISSLSDDALLEKLMTVHGVGIKVASCVALFAYGRKGVAPVDTWIRKMIDAHYAGVNPFPSYGNVAGVMQQYVFFNAIGAGDPQ